MLNRVFAFLLLVILSPLLLVISVTIVLEDGFPIFFRQKRVGIRNGIFIMYKFRTMKKNTPDIATHLLSDPGKYIIKIGNILRKLSLDELPNLFNILKGEMNFVGPRPALYNQYDLIKLRTRKGVHLLKPGLTGWAQINGRDEISIKDKVNLDSWYKSNNSLNLRLKIIYMTFFNTIIGKDVSH